jgi:hypothetical protein
MSEWKPIESAPEDEAVWIYCTDDMRHIAVAERSWDWTKLRYVITWKVFWPECNVKKTITHWQPLPAPPTEEAGGRT